MSELKKYVDSLFAHVKTDRKMLDLKDEILSNLEAKMQDLIKQGMDEETALQKAKASITSIDSMIDGNRLVYVDRFKTECLQSVLLYLIIAWILATPLIIVRGFSLLNALLLLGVIGVGIAYFIKKLHISETVGFCNIESFQKSKRLIWIVWSIFYGMCALLITALYFGSNIWFRRMIHIDGPYQFFIIAVRYYAPLITIFIPICVGSFTKILRNSEVRDDR